ncbi:MAG: hypothetical protein NTZ90_11150 [Proteobacteria bacterium]|nr:hypothetical protein [Pseudomonadota bacterium]
MKHVKQIAEIIDAGATTEAHLALDQLLALGPQNTAALKLRARLLEMEGRFSDEALIWDRIATIDREDEDAVAYLFRRQKEDREHFYFTDDVAGGGRRFTACPNSLITFSAIGLVGCLAFLAMTHFADATALLADPRMMLSIFAICVVMPWVAIVLIYLRCLRFVIVTPAGITISTRLKTHQFSWNELGTVSLAHNLSGKSPRLWLTLEPKDEQTRPVHIDMTLGSTALRARAYLIREITRHHAEPDYVVLDDLGRKGRKPARY